MTDIRVVPVIMAGGSGTRLWPLSRAGFPKQFLVLSGNRSLFQQAVKRLDTFSDDGLAVGAPLVVGNEEHRFLVLEQLREIGRDDATVLLEPAGRNTAPALTLAALQAVAEGDDPVLAVLSADQAIAQDAVFVERLQKSARVAATGAIVILGIRPDRPETGFGYLRAGTDEATNGDRVVERFVEKPDLETARGYLAAGDYFWNAGLFVLKASVWLAALRAFRPDVLAATEKAFAARTIDRAFVRPSREAFLAVPAESIDYAVIERCPGSAFPIRMLALDAGWSDLGAWDAVWQSGERDNADNVCRGDTLLLDTKSSLVHATQRMVAVVGLDDVVVVETADAVLVTSKTRAQDVKQIVARLHDQKREEHLLHRKVQRPWGWYDSVDEGERFKVKRIMVKPGASLSLQMHHHRAEHWIVVSGTAEVTCGERRMLVSENQSTYIPLGEKHRLANPGSIPLEIVEVQSGSYLGEDDIVRFEDTYGRTEKS